VVLACFHEYDRRWHGQLFPWRNLHIGSAPWVNTAESSEY
jgi:hypothetical protein